MREPEIYVEREGQSTMTAGAVYVRWDDRGPIYRLDRDGTVTEQLRVPTSAAGVK